MIFILYHLAQVACGVLAAPATSSQPQVLSNWTQHATDASLSSEFTSLSMLLITSNVSVTSTSLLEPADNSSSQFTYFDGSSSATTVSYPPSVVSSSSSPFSSRFSSLPAPATFITKVTTTFETTTLNVAPPSTSVVTVVVTASASATVPIIPPSSWSNRTLWAAPSQMTDLSAFNITYFPSGEQNLHIVAQVPPQAIAPTAKSLQEPFPSPNTTTSTILQLVYPARSVNPSSEPEGGADFYATPLNLSGARNVTLEYSVFFPVDFDWVKGGKLPGLFGGHTGCSGGKSADDCFSTRLMWRPQGIGELYLYAPKDRQTEALCADVASVCDTAYGFSIGRGAFNFTAGDWTHLKQAVILNTPGENDGMFTLFVDGQPMIHRTDIFYRHITQQVRKNKSTTGSEQPVEFLGLFFSTFFGGHGKAYATPKQQYTWFKDFSITRHD